MTNQPENCTHENYRDNLNGYTCEQCGLEVAQCNYCSDELFATKDLNEQGYCDACVLYMSTLAE